MAHTFAGRGGDAGDVGRYRFGHILLDKSRCLFFGGAADLTDHDDRIGVGIGLEQPEDIKMVGAVDRVAAYADAG